MVEWKFSNELISYPEAIAFMEARVGEIRAGTAEECVWLVEHPPLYTAGTSANPQDLLEKDRFPLFETGRGGQMTYHGPGQRVAYVMLDLKRRAGEKQVDLRAFVQSLERWIVRTLAHFGVASFVREGRIGVWVETPQGEKKIAALGIRIRGGVSYHGIAVNVHPDLSHFSSIVPCGISAYGVTSLADLGIAASLEEVDRCLQREFGTLFGPSFPELR